MIFFWNRKKIYTGNSTEKIRKIVSTLRENNIKFKHKAARPNSAYHFGTGASTFGENNTSIDFYFMYVHKKDYEKASELLKDII